MTEFRILNKNPLLDYKEACKITQGINIDINNAVYTLKDETSFWVKQIVANHSTIRSIKFRIKTSAPKSVVMQLIRATKGHPQPFVQSSRPDWNDGKERSNDPYEEKLFIMDHTAESFVEMCKQRLCNRTEKRTRGFIADTVIALRHSEEPFLKAVGYCCHANCWWFDGRCPEINGCNHSEKLSEKVIEWYKERELQERINKEDIKW